MRMREALPGIRVMSDPTYYRTLRFGTLRQRMGEYAIVDWDEPYAIPASGVRNCKHQLSLLVKVHSTEEEDELRAIYVLASLGE